MAETIPLDTNAYVRLAVHFHPLLQGIIPGEDGRELLFLGKLYHELKRTPRLRHELEWTYEREYVENRKRCKWLLSAGVKTEMGNTYDFIFRYAQTSGKSASPFDIQCLPCGLVLIIRIVTDDQEMLRPAAAKVEFQTPFQ